MPNGRIDGVKLLEKIMTDRGTPFIFLLAFSVSGVCSTVSPAPEKVLMDSLLENYSPAARPLKDPAKSIDVLLTFIPFNIEELDEKLQTMKVKAILRMVWNDDFFRWNKSLHYGMERMVLLQSLVWRPDIIYYNGVGSINNPIQTELNKVIAYSDGRMEWDAEGTFTVSCSIDVRHFPFDEQTCGVNLSNNKYTLREVHPTLVSTEDNLQNMTQNGQWVVKNYFIHNDESTGVKYMSFTFRLKRRSAFYVMNMMLPSLGLAVLGNCLYLIPPDSTDRVTVGTTLVLAYTVFMLQVTELTPGSFQVVPYITMFLLAAMGLASLTVVVSIIVLRLSRSHSDKSFGNLHEKGTPSEWRETLQRHKRTIKRVDITFFLLNLLALLCLAGSVVMMSLW